MNRYDCMLGKRYRVKILGQWVEGEVTTVDTVYEQITLEFYEGKRVRVTAAPGAFRKVEEES